MFSCLINPQRKTFDAANANVASWLDGAIYAPSDRSQSPVREADACSHDSRSAWLFGHQWFGGGYIHLFMLGNMMAYDADCAVEAIAEHVKLFGLAPKEFTEFIHRF
ncbi:MAG: hypothetical protein NDI61_13775 [Bdellovibrionaceae bacterium]|nr:hypothetical protein [Pseudobdellovibrionaceae bacterium]